MGDYDERIPRHAKGYRNFGAEFAPLQEERIVAFGEYVADVKEGRFPDKGNVLGMKDEEFERAKGLIESGG